MTIAISDNALRRPNQLMHVVSPRLQKHSVRSASDAEISTLPFD